MENRGGKRPGAGRKEIDPNKKRVQFCVSVRPETKELAARLRENGIKLGQHIDQLVMDLYEEMEYINSCGLK